MVVIGPGGTSRQQLAVVVLIAALVAGPQARAGAPLLDGRASTNGNELATRARHEPPPLVGPIDHVAIVGDSMYFESLGPGGRNTILISLIRNRLRFFTGNPSLRFDNLSRPGLATKYPLEGANGVALYSWVTSIFPPSADNPDVVVLPATSIDLNVVQNVEATALAPVIADEMQRVVDYLTAIGIQPVVVPAFGINDAMFDRLKSFNRPIPVQCNANARTNILNDVLARRDLPMLFTSFQGTDLDNDGDVDEANFVNFHPGHFPDDGVHTNAVGDALIGAQIADRLAEAILAST